MTLLHALGSARNGGAETFFVSLIREFHSRGHDQAAVVKKHPGRLSALGEMGIPCRTAPFGGLLDPWTGHLMKKTASTSGADAILTWMSRASWHAPARKATGPRVIARVGGFYNMKYYRNCDHIITIAPQIADHLANQGWPREKLSIIPNFCAVDFDVPAADRVALQTPADAPVILALSRLHPVKGLDVLIRAVAGIDGATLWLAGDGDERESLTKLAQELGVDGRVRFLGWRDDRAALINAADIIAFPSRREPLGSVVVEAWAGGKPLVASDVDGPAWLIDHGETGLLAPPDDVDALRTHLSALIESPQEAARLAANGKRQAETTYARPRIIDAYEQALISAR